LPHRQCDAADARALQRVHHLHHRLVAHRLVGTDHHRHVRVAALQRAHARAELGQRDGLGVALVEPDAQLLVTADHHLHD